MSGSTRVSTLSPESPYSRAAFVRCVYPNLSKISLVTINTCEPLTWVWRYCDAVAASSVSNPSPI